MKILFSIASGFGDALFFAPTLLRLREIYPHAQFTALVPNITFNRALLQQVLKVDQLIHLERAKNWTPKAVWTYLKIITRLTRQIRADRYDLFICSVQARLPDQYLLLLTSGAQTKIGPKMWRRIPNPYRLLLSESFSSPKPSHICLDHFSVTTHLCPTQHESIVPYLVSLNAELRARAVPAPDLCLTNKLLIFLPGSGSQPYKRWPFERFLSVAQHLLDNSDYEIALIGGPTEYESSLIPPHLNASPRFHNLGFDLSLNHLIWVFTKATLVLSNDSGLLHLAEVLQVPSIGIYPTNWTYVSAKHLCDDGRHEILPAHEHDQIVKYLEFGKSRSKALQHQCRKIVESVTVDQVITRIKQKLPPRRNL